MTNQARTATIALTATLGLAAPARADERQDILAQIGEEASWYYIRMASMRNGYTSAKPNTPDRCEADFKAWRAKGVKDDDVLEGDFRDHPRRTSSRTVPFSLVLDVCAEYRPVYDRFTVSKDLEGASWGLDNMQRYEPGSSAESMEAGWLKAGDAAACKASIATARALDPAMKIQDRTLDAHDTEVCDELAAIAPKWAAAAKANAEAAEKKFKAPYLAAGIAGDKLELIWQYAGIYFEVKGGARTDDPAKLKRASVLFRWLEDNNDPGSTLHTLHRYQFKGNKLVKQTAKEYRVRKGDNPPPRAWK